MLSRVTHLFYSKFCLSDSLNHLLFQNLLSKCQSCYVDETKLHFPVRIKEYFETDEYKELRIFHYLEHNFSYLMFLMKFVLR